MFQVALARSPVLMVFSGLQDVVATRNPRFALIVEPPLLV